MNQSQVINLDVKLSLSIDNETSLKRIPAVQTHKDLYDQCRQFINKLHIPKVSLFNIVYFDSDNERIKVEDDSDLQMAYAVALSADGKLKFHIEIGKVQAQPEVVKPEIAKPVLPLISEPVVIKAPVKPEIVQQPPQLIMEQPVVIHKPVVGQQPVQPVIEEVKAEAKAQPDQKKGKNANKAQKPKEKGLPRKALKTLMQQEFEKQSRIIFDKLLKDKGIGFQVSEGEESKEPVAEQVITHVGVSCDGCGESPIIGVRYKCAVCKDFDYCANCEEKLDHDHPFLKIKKAGGAPTVMVTVLNEEAEPAQAEQQQQHHGHGHGHHGHHGHQGKGHGWKHMVNGFLEKMGLDPEIVKEQFKDQFQCGKNPWSFANGDRCRQNGHWKNKRAILVTKPNEVLEACAGQVLLPSIEVRNSTHWPWKQGCFLGMDESVNLQNMPIDFINVPVDFEVRGQENFKLNIPITVLPTAFPSDQIYEFVLCFRGPNGNQFGEQIPLKIKIVAPTSEQTEIEIYKLAYKLHDLKLGKNLEECLSAVQQANCNEAEAVKILQSKQQ